MSIPYTYEIIVLKLLNSSRDSILIYLQGRADLLELMDFLEVYVQEGDWEIAIETLTEYLLEYKIPVGMSDYKKIVWINSSPAISGFNLNETMDLELRNLILP